MNTYKNRVWHVMRPNHKNTIPDRLLFLDTETREDKKTDTQTMHYMKIACTCYIKRIGDNWDKYNEDWNTFNKPEEVLGYVEQLTAPGKSLYIVGSNILFDLLVTGFIPYFAEKGWTKQFLYNGNISFILNIRKDKNYIRCLSTQNFAPIGVSEMGKAVGKAKMDIDFKSAPAEYLEEYCKRDVEIIRDFTLDYIRLIRKEDMGNFCFTRASQALALYRHRYMRHKIEIHDNDFASDIEKNAYFGGRNECFKLGDFIGDKVTCLDINSMYPYVMQSQEYPIKLVNVGRKISSKYLEENIDNYCYCAEVELDTNEPAYAVKHNNRLVFPIGRFTAYLCTPGLKHAINNGHIVKVNRIAMYEKANIFHDYVKYLYKLRLRYKQKNKGVWEQMCKYLLNSLYGKFGQMADKIVYEKDIDIKNFYRKSFYNMDTKQHYIIEEVFGKRIMYEGKIPTNNTFHAIPAHVTEHARLYLWEIIKAVGIKNIYYCDTDSLFIKSRHVSKLEKYINPDKIGYLKIEGRTKRLKIYGCKDYVFGDKTRLKGIRKDAVKLSEVSYCQDQFPSLYRIMREKINIGFPVYKLTKVLKRQYKKGTVIISGDVLPFQFPFEAPTV